MLRRLEEAGKGRIIIYPGGSVEQIQLNSTDPWTTVDGERSSIKTSHPSLGDPAVREALALLVDRDSVGKYIYGRTGTATSNYVNNPEQFRSKNTTREFSIDKAVNILEKAGWRMGTDGIRAKDGKQLKYVFQTSINQPRKKTQAIAKKACEKAGIPHDLTFHDIRGSAVTRRPAARCPKSRPLRGTRLRTSRLSLTRIISVGQSSLPTLRSPSWSVPRRTREPMANKNCKTAKHRIRSGLFSLEKRKLLSDFNGGRTRTRTLDPLIKSQNLFI